MYANKLGYAKVDQTGAGSLVKRGPTGFFGGTVVSSTAATITVYDNTSATGDILFQKTGLTAGEVISFGGLGFAAKVGLYVVVGGTGLVNILYT